MTKIAKGVSAAAALMLLAIGSTSAFAHGKGHGGHGFHRFHHHSHFRIRLGGGEGCGFYRVQWYETGSFYWKRKYYICKGWW